MPSERDHERDVDAEALADNYQDIDGKPVTLDKLCRTEPEWAANCIRTVKALLAERIRERDEAWEREKQWAATAHQANVNTDTIYRRAAAAESALAAMTKERDIYKRAKKENDDRFMLERDAARRESERLRGALQILDGELLDQGDGTSHAAGEALVERWAEIVDAALRPAAGEEAGA